MIKKKDQNGDVLESITSIPQQLKQAWQETEMIKLPKQYKKIDNIVVSGMGGSSYGARIAKSLYDGAQITRTPIELCSNYHLPGYVGKNSLVILSSYSGNTEEVLENAKQAKEKKANIIVLSSGGKLALFAKKYSYPSYIFKPVFNPSNQPRLGVGYMVMGLIGLLANLGKVPVGRQEVEKIVSFLSKKQKVDLRNTLTDKLKEKIVVFIAADFLEGAVYALRNMLHETAKQFAVYFIIPDANHHLMEGLSFPAANKDVLGIVLIKSSIYDPKNQKSLEITQEIVKSNKISQETINLKGNSALTQVFELLYLGAGLSFVLAMKNKVDPAKVPWVDYFKKRLVKEEK